MFGPRLVQDRIRVVEMNEHFAHNLDILQQTQTLFHWKVSHLVRGLATTQNAQQFVIAPEGAVEQKQVHMTDLFEQRIAETVDGGDVSHSLSRRGFKEQRSRRFVACQVRRLTLNILRIAARKIIDLTS